MAIDEVPDRSLVVGESASLAETMAAMRAAAGGPSGRFAGPPARCAALLKHLGTYQLYLNVFRGGRYIFLPPSGTMHPVTGEPIRSYLEQHAKESDTDFLIRLRNSFTLPYIKEIISIFTSTLFRQEVVRDPAISVFSKDYVSNIDLAGHSAREFLRRAFALAQVEGWVGCLTDYPRASGQYLSRYHELQAQARPYSRLILPTQLWDWERDPATRDFTYALIWNGVEGDGGRWQRWYPDGWEVIDSLGVVKRWGLHTFGRVPLDVLACGTVDSDADDEPLGWSALVDVAHTMLHVYQLCSLLETHERLALFAFLHIRRDPPMERQETAAAAPDVELGSAHYLWTESEVQWVEPPASVPAEARDQILWAIQEVRRASGVSTRSEDSTEAHSGVALEWEYSTRHNLVYERAMNLEDFESRLWRTHGRWIGEDLPVDFIRYPREYATQPVDAELGEIERLTQLAQAWGPDMQAALLPLIRQKLRRVAIRDVGHLPEIDDVLASIEGMSTEPEPEEIETSEQPGSDAMDAAAQRIEEIKGDLAVVESLIKSKTPDPVIRVLVRRVLAKLGVTDAAALASLSGATFRWYTEVQAEISATGESADEIEEATP